jgi:hypothetical protein
LCWAVLGFALHASAYAATSSTKAPIDLRDRALQEIQQQGKHSNRSTDAQVANGTGMLSLEDPMPKARGRSWDYFIRFALQVYSPAGVAGNDLSHSRFSLDSIPPAIMPALTVGFRSNLIKSDAWSLAWGLGGRLAYTSEKSHACFTTGFCEKEAQLNTLMTSGIPELILKFARFNKWSFNAGPELGTLNYSQTSGNKFAAFSAQSPYIGYTAGAEYAFAKSRSALFSYTHRELTKSTDLGIQANNYELGTRLTW